MRIPASWPNHRLQGGMRFQRMTFVWTQPRSPQQRGSFLLGVARPAGSSIPMRVVKAAKGKMVNHVKSLSVSTQKGGNRLSVYWPKTVSRSRLASEEVLKGDLTETQKKGKEGTTSFSAWPQHIKHLAPCVALFRVLLAVPGDAVAS